MEVFLGDLFERGEFIDARVVHEDVQQTERLLRFLEQAVDVRFLRDIGLNRDGPAALGGDLGDDLVRAGPAGGVIDDDGGSFRGELFGDGGADAFGRAGDDRDFAVQFFGDVVAHMFGLVVGFG